MNLDKLPKVKARSYKRLGRGIGSGRGKTAGRGTKGQKSRGNLPTQLISGKSLYEKLPLKKGKGNPKMSVKPVIVSLGKLTIFKKGEVVDAQLLISRGVIKENSRGGVKILGTADKLEALIIKLPISKNARAVVEKMGGKVADA